MARSISLKNLLLGFAAAPAVIGLSGCALASLPANYSPIEKQTVEELNGANYTPRSDEEREAIATQDLFAQTAFWSREYDLNPADLEAAINLAANLRKMGNSGKSIEVAQHTRALYPRDVDLMTELAASYIADHKTNEAIKILDTALYQRPRNARLWSLKGAALDQLERFAEARQHYTKALAVAPNDPGILANVGLSYALEGDPKTAEIWLRRAAALPGASPSVRQNLALVLGLQGNLDEAETWAKQDLDQEGAANNLAYIRSLRGSSSPKTSRTVPASSSTKTSRVYGQTTPKVTPQKASVNRTVPARTAPTRNTPRASYQAAPQQSQRPANFGTKIAIAGDPAKMTNGPQTVSEATMEVLRQRNAALRNAPAQPASTPSPASQQPGAGPTVLDKISENNTPKTVIAQQQQAYLAQRAAYVAQQQQQNYPYPPRQQPGPMNPSVMANGQPVPPGYVPPQPYYGPNPYYAPQAQNAQEIPEPRPRRR